MNGSGLNASGLDAAGSSGDTILRRLPIRIRVAGELEISIPIEISVYTTLPNYTTASRRRASVRLNGVNVTSSLTGQVRVEAEEGQARIAQFTIVVDSGAVDLTTWIGTEVIIDHDTMTGSTVILRERLFTGIVDVPKIDIQTGQVTFHCTDDLQTVIDALSRDEIDELTPDAVYSDPINGKDKRGFEYMTIRVDSLTASFDLDPMRAPRLTSWDAATSPDITFEDNGVVYLSELIELANAKDLINSVEVDFKYRFTRLKEKIEQGRWQHPALTNFCDFLVDPTDIPNREMIISALRGTGWTLTSASFTPIFPAGEYECIPDDIVWFPNPPEIVDQLVFAASWTLKKRYTQTITENYTLRIAAPESEAGKGPRPATRSSGLTAEYDAGEWIKELTDESVLMIDSFQVGGSGDSAVDKDDVEGATRDDAEAGMSWEISHAKRVIREAHRRNLVAFDVLLDPRVDLDKTIRIDTDRITAKGKVKRVSHVFNLEQGKGGTSTGNAITSIQLAISRSYTPSSSYAIDDDPVEVPVKPETRDPDNVPLAVIVDRSNHFGGYVASDPFDDSWEGFTGNYTGSLLPEIGAEPYPVSFRVDSPSVDPTDVDELQPITEREYNVSIPNDQLVVTAP